MVSVANVETSRPPMTARPSGADCAPLSPIPMAIGSIPKIIAAAVISTARSRPLAPSRVASGVARLFRECDQQNGVGHPDSNSHNRAHERLDVESGAGPEQHQ